MHSESNLSLLVHVVVSIKYNISESPVYQKVFNKYFFSHSPGINILLIYTCVKFGNTNLKLKRKNKAYFSYHR